MKFRTTYSTKPVIVEAIYEISKKIQDNDTAMILYFASSVYNPDELSETMQVAFPGILTVGCSTAGEIVTGKMMEKSIVAMAFSKKIIGNPKVEILTGISNEQNVEKAFSSFEAHFGEPVSQMNHNDYVGIALMDGLCRCEEKVLEKIGDQTNVRFIGGSAGDDFKFEKTYLFANGKAYTDAGILILMKPKTQFDTLKVQSFKSSGKKLKITKAYGTRQVIEFNNKPAVQAYAEVYGVAEKDIEQYFYKRPMGLMDFSDQPFVRSPGQIEGSSIIFNSSIAENMELEILDATDIIADTEEVIHSETGKMNGISAIIDFHCAHRFLDLKAQNKTDEYGLIYKDVPAIGFATYGEYYIGHVNQTSSILIFK